MTTQLKQDLLVFLKKSLRNDPVEPRGESISACRVGRRGHGLPLFALGHVAQMAKSSGFVVTANGWCTHFHTFFLQLLPRTFYDECISVSRVGSVGVHSHLKKWDQEGVSSKQS
eukprot:SAG31_NODE_4346_length_3329_cov_1.499690_5_plen_114_part_00